jgi:aquaporin Z
MPEVKEYPTTTQCIVAEFVGTFLLVFTVGCNVMGGTGIAGVLSIASVLTVSIFALGSVSGANFNPAVSLALFMNGNLSFGKMATYMLTQVVAGICAGLSYLSLYGDAMNLEPGAGVKWHCAGAVEFLYTFMLVFVVLRAAVADVNPDSKEYFAPAIGFVIIAGGYAVGGISGGAFNPAVAIGVDVASAWQGVYYCGVYSLFEFAGAAAAVMVHKFVDSPPGVTPSMAKKCVSEFIGTYFLILTVGFNVLMKSPAGALSIASSLMCMIYALGGVSGANFNPAVTLTLLISGKGDMNVTTMGAYMVSQVAGGLCAAMTYIAIMGEKVALLPSSNKGLTTAFVAETIYTFVLCFVVLNVACTSDKKPIGGGGKAVQIYGLAIGFCVVVGGVAIGPLSGGSLNPAVSVALDATSGKVELHSLAYTAFEFIGAGLAAGVFMALRDDAYAKGAGPYKSAIDRA